MIVEHESSTRRPSSSLINRLYIWQTLVMYVLCMYINLIAFAIGINMQYILYVSNLVCPKEVAVFHECVSSFTVQPHVQP